MTRIQSILELLGPDATSRDALRVSLALQALYPGVPVQHLPAGALDWLNHGVGEPPRSVYTPASATSLMGLFEGMSESQQAQLLDAAKALAGEDDDGGTRPAANPAAA